MGKWLHRAQRKHRRNFVIFLCEISNASNTHMHRQLRIFGDFKRINE